MSTFLIRDEERRSRSSCGAGAFTGDWMYPRRMDWKRALSRERESARNVSTGRGHGETCQEEDGHTPEISLTVSRLRASSLHVLPCASRNVSSISDWSSNSVTISPLPSDAARCNAVVPDSGGWIELGEIER